MPQLDPTWFISQLFWLLVSLGVLYVVLSRLALPSLMAVLELRRTTRAGDLERATRLKAEAEAARAEYERVLAEARLRAQGVFAEVELQGKQAAEKALVELNSTQHARLGEAQTRIAKSKNELLQALKPAVADLASLTVEKLLAKRPDDKQVQAVVQQLLQF